MEQVTISEEELKLLILKVAIHDEYDEVQKLKRTRQDYKRCTRCKKLRRISNLKTYKGERLCSGCYGISKARENPLPMPKERPPDLIPTTLERLVNPKEGSATVTMSLDEFGELLQKMDRNLEKEAKQVNSRNRSVSKQIWKGRG